MKLKIMSLNLAGYKDWTKRDERSRNYIDEIEADIIVLQEVRFNKSKSAYNQATELNRLLKQKYDFEGISISRFYKPKT